MCPKKSRIPATLRAAIAMELMKRLPRGATENLGRRAGPSPTLLPCSQERAMLKFVQRLVARFLSRATVASTPVRPRRVVLGVEAFEDRLVPAVVAFDLRQSIPVEQIRPAAEQQLTYWSWGESQLDAGPH